MTAKILALPNAAPPEPRPVFDVDTASESETAAYLAGAQSVIDLLGPLLAKHGIHIPRPRQLRRVS
jgi:hypothetical protein